ncbi:MAG: hypothetical protein HC900_03195 [Methylacidiphilales bacterium]|nr:hypothetical protein [Candidatus Methylacidiphilales bacterium]
MHMLRHAICSINVFVTVILSAMTHSHADDSCSSNNGVAANSRSIYNIVPGGKYITTVCQNVTRPEDKRPAVWIEKSITSQRQPDGNFDNGAAYFQTVKPSGSSHGVALTGSAIHNGGTGSLIGVHGRAMGRVPTSELFAGWFYADSLSPFRVMTGVEINLRNRGRDSPWAEGGFRPGTSIGLNIAMADRSTFPGTHALYIAAQQGSRGWRTGFFMPSGAIEPTDTQGNGEAFRIHGAKSPDASFILARAMNGHFVSGFETFEGDFQRGIIEMSYGQYLNWRGKTTDTASSRLSVSDNRVLNFSGSGFRLQPTSSPPLDPEDGTVVFVDGKNWNPGGGAGFYGFDGTSWKKL